MDIKKDIDKAIEYIKESRDTHKDWAIWHIENPTGGGKLETIERIAGDEDFHYNCMAKYDFVINVLEKLK